MSSKNDREPLADAKRSLAFLTRLPTGEGVTNPEGGLADAAWTFPLVGTFVGACGGFAFWIAHAAGLAPTLSGLAAVGAACLLTGCLHEDGLADVADGFGGGSDHDSKLAIMRDSRIGAYGVIALCTSVLARVLALAAFVDAAAALAALLAAGALSRAAIVPVMAGLPPARTDGMSSFAGRPVPRRPRRSSLAPSSRSWPWAYNRVFLRWSWQCSRPSAWPILHGGRSAVRPAMCWVPRPRSPKERYSSYSALVEAV